MTLACRRASSRLMLRYQRRYLLSGAGGGYALGCCRGPRQSQCAAPPPAAPTAFAWTGRRYSHNNNSHGPLRDTDCPICEKYGTGPCGPLFWNWWDCTESSTRVETDHVTVCAQEFERFRACVDQHQVDAVDADKVQGTAHAWQEFLETELARFERHKFPAELSPKQEHIGTLVGEVSLVDESRDGLSLLAAIVVQESADGDHDEGSVSVIAGASSLEMLARKGNRKSIVYMVPRESKSLKVIAAYEEGDGSGQVFEQRITLP